MKYQTRFPDAPPQIAALPVDRRGYPVPYFVSKVDGEWEFRAVDPRKVFYAENHGLCWICGLRMHGSLKAFTIGPMCAVNRVSSEPPSHPGCARFAVASCPFLTKPMAKRRPMGDGIQTEAPAGMMIERNPGVTLIWICRDYRTQKDRNGLLFKIGTPLFTEWYAEGRTATRAEIMASIESGYPLLYEVAAEEGPEAIRLLETMYARGLKLVPAD